MDYIFNMTIVMNEDTVHCPWEHLPHQVISTGSLSYDSPWSYPFGHESSWLCCTHQGHRTLYDFHPIIISSMKPDGHKEQIKSLVIAQIPVMGNSNSWRSPQCTASQPNSMWHHNTVYRWFSVCNDLCAEGGKYTLWISRLTQSCQPLEAQISTQHLQN